MSGAAAQLTTHKGEHFTLDGTFQLGTGSLLQCNSLAQHP